MKRAFKRRPDTFKRRIVVCLDSRAELLLEEERLLQLIPDEELGAKYYNLHKHTGHWHGRSDRAIVVEKLRASWTDERRKKAQKTQSLAWTQERKAKFKELVTGRRRSEATKQKMRAAVTLERKATAAHRLREITRKRFENYWETHHTRKEKLELERKQNGYVPPNRSEIAKSQWSQKSIEQKVKTRAAMSKASIGKTYVIDPTGAVKRVPLAELETWIAAGWQRGRTLTPSKESLRKRKF
jgi:hypothetical protein